MAHTENATSIRGPSQTLYFSGVQNRIASLNGRTASTDEFVGLADLLGREDTSRTEIFYTDLTRKIKVETPGELVELAAYDLISGSKAICVIENISPICIEVLGSKWDLDPDFFVRHVKNPDQEHLWWHHSDEDRHRRYQHLDGNYEYHDMKGQERLNSLPNYILRHCYENPPYSVQSNTRISYYRVTEYLYLFLVDAPLDIMMQHIKLYPMTRPTLRLPYAMNRGGLLLPTLFPQTKYSLFDSLKSFFQHGWHFNVLFDGDEDTIPGRPLLYMLSSSLWESNLTYLTREINRLSLEEVRDPNLKINSEMHARRENLVFMKSCLIETIKYVPSEVDDYFDQHNYFLHQALSQRTSVKPIRNHELILEQTLQLNNILTDAFQLLMSSISVRDSQLNIEQSQSAARLTQLAFIYAPLSFVTGIFGMNVRQINSTGLSIWVFVVTLAITLLLTVTIFGLLRIRGKKKKREGDWTHV